MEEIENKIKTFLIYISRQIAFRSMFIIHVHIYVCLQR